ncbi:hypothetical protein M011DRAFT_344489 [Sporormia fimetaria CBS 119925]|uniref:Rhodopsin domain-containing protein n=1 Tax=Sporormia fimetaria CBS 119925 TaxID=1340428 RepID=A0A6A6VFG9_9PLEO|nr:hypothetical protein M011DRAFT_344489 [Sporormia fimetaria CBS 119925]
MFAPWDLGPTVAITAWTLTAFSTLVVGVRFGCRLWVVGRLKLYDYIMMLAVLCAWGLCVANHYQLETGTGQQMRSTEGSEGYPELTPEMMKWLEGYLATGARAWFAYRISYVVCLGLIKISILVFYLSFATSRVFKNLVIITLVVVSLFTVVTGFFNGFECPQDPGLTLSHRIFDPVLSQGCYKRHILYYAQAGFNIFSDIVILVLPMPSLLKLRMPTLKRCCLIAVFSLGLIVPIASALRIWALVIWGESQSDPKGQYNGAYMLFWSQVEINTAIVCASAPSLQPIFRCVFGRLVSYRMRSAYYYYGDGEGGATMAQRDAQPSRTADTCVESLGEPPSAYKVQKRASIEMDQVIREADDEEQLKDRIRHFASRSSLGSASTRQNDWPLVESNQQNTPQQPKEVWSYG